MGPRAAQRTRCRTRQPARHGTAELRFSAHTLAQNDGPSAPCDAWWRKCVTDTSIAWASLPRRTTHPCTSSNKAKQPQLRAPGPGACISTPRAAWRAWRPETGLGPRAQRLDRDLGEGEEQQAAAVRGHMALLAELLALHGGRLDAMLRQDAAEARVRAALAWGIG